MGCSQRGWGALMFQCHVGWSNRFEKQSQTCDGFIPPVSGEQRSPSNLLRLSSNGETSGRLLALWTCHGVTIVTSVAIVTTLLSPNCFVNCTMVCTDTGELGHGFFRTVDCSLLLTALTALLKLKNFRLVQLYNDRTMYRGGSSDCTTRLGQEPLCCLKNG